MIAAGSDRSTPCAIVFDAAGPREAVWRGTLAQLAAGSASRLVELERSGLPGLVIVGHAAACSWPKLGVLAGRRVLVTASEAVQPRIRLMVEDLGGRPVSWPMIELRARPLPDICKGGYDAIVLTSPSAVRIFFENCVMDRRRLPMFFTCGAGTDAELRRWGVASDVMPEKDFSAAGLIASIRKMASCYTTTSPCAMPTACRRSTTCISRPLRRWRLSLRRTVRRRFAGRGYM